LNVVFVGGGRMAHNLIGLVESAGWTVAGVLDDAPGDDVLGHRVELLETHAGPERDALLTIGAPASRRAVVERYADGRFRWAAFRHPQAVVSSYATLGEGTFIAPFTTMANVQLGAHAVLMPFTLLGTRVCVGAFSFIASHCSLSSDVRIGRECLIGVGAKILAGVTIGDRCTIAAGALVRKDLPDDTFHSPEGRLRTVRRA
jgi:sugar O-acyltransferase (sialic acid O-acetyltransferase NeuD family)